MYSNADVGVEREKQKFMFLFFLQFYQILRLEKFWLCGVIMLKFPLTPPHLNRFVITGFRSPIIPSPPPPHSSSFASTSSSSSLLHQFMHIHRLYMWLEVKFNDFRFFLSKSTFS